MAAPAEHTKPVRKSRGAAGFGGRRSAGRGPGSDLPRAGPPGHRHQAPEWIHGPIMADPRAAGQVDPSGPPDMRRAGQRPPDRRPRPRALPESPGVAYDRGSVNGAPAESARSQPSGARAAGPSRGPSDDRLVRTGATSAAPGLNGPPHGTRGERRRAFRRFGGAWFADPPVRRSLGPRHGPVWPGADIAGSATGPSKSRIRAACTLVRRIGRLGQWRKWRTPVRSIVAPAASATATTSESFFEPPGWTKAVTPASRHASTASGNG